METWNGCNSNLKWTALNKWRTGSDPIEIGKKFRIERFASHWLNRSWPLEHSHCPNPKWPNPQSKTRIKWSLMTMNWFKGQFWPYSPAILQVKVFYSSSIILENRIACERCQKYFKVKLNDLPTVYDHWLKVTGLLIKISDPLYWWRSFIGGWCIFIKIAYFISRSYIMSSDRLAQRHQNIFGIHMVILMWFPKSNWLDRTGHDPGPSHGRPVRGRFHGSVHVYIPNNGWI